MKLIHSINVSDKRIIELKSAIENYSVKVQNEINN